MSVLVSSIVLAVDCAVDDDCRYLNSVSCNNNVLIRDIWTCVDYSCQLSATTDDCNNYNYFWCSGKTIVQQRGICDSNAQICILDQTFFDDCSHFDLPEIAECNYIPDVNARTWDYFEGWSSQCIEDNGNADCEQPIADWKYMWIEHKCDKSRCGAECEKDDECMPYCGSNPQGSVIYKNGRCNVYDYFPEDYCTCLYSSVEFCYLHNAWYDTQNLRWLDTGNCVEIEQREQEYREYFCEIEPVCKYEITNRQWVDTGNTRPIEDGRMCDDGKFCTTNDICAGGGQCTGTNTVDCSFNNLFIDTCSYNPDNIDFTLDFYSFASSCDEDSDSCTSAPANWQDSIAHMCDTGCGAECGQYTWETNCNDTYSCYLYNQVQVRPAAACLTGCTCYYGPYGQPHCEKGKCGAACSNDADCPQGQYCEPAGCLCLYTQNTAPVAIKINISGKSNDSANVIAEMKSIGSGIQRCDVYNITTNSLGEAVIDNVPYGLYNITADIKYYVRNIVNNVDVSGPGTYIDFGFMYPGDFNDDNKVSALDIGRFSYSYGSSKGDAYYNPECDMNGDDKVNVLDIPLFSTNYGRKGAGKLC